MSNNQCRHGYVHSLCPECSNKFDIENGGNKMNNKQHLAEKYSPHINQLDVNVPDEVNPLIVKRYTVNQYLERMLDEYESLQSIPDEEQITFLQNLWDDLHKIKNVNNIPIKALNDVALRLAGLIERNKK